jgi:hypothetical protein
MPLGLIIRASSATLTGGAGGLRPALKRLRIDARASHHNHLGVGGFEAEFARVFRVLEHAHRSGTPHEVADDPANDGADGGRNRTALDPHIAQTGQRKNDRLPTTRRPHRKAAQNRHGQRDAMNDGRLFGANDPRHLRNALQERQRIQAPAPACQRHEPVPLPDHRLAMPMHAGGDHDLEAAGDGSLRHGAKMRYEGPVLGREVQYLRHCLDPGSTHQRVYRHPQLT